MDPVSRGLKYTDWMYTQLEDKILYHHHPQKKGCPWYDTKLHLMTKFQFCLPLFLSICIHPLFCCYLHLCKAKKQTKTPATTFCNIAAFNSSAKLQLIKLYSFFFFFAVYCPKGYYNSSATLCKPCAKGTFKSQPGNSECQSCPNPAYTISINGSTTANDCTVGK